MHSALEGVQLSLCASPLGRAPLGRMLKIEPLPASYFCIIPLSSHLRVTKQIPLALHPIKLSSLFCVMARAPFSFQFFTVGSIMGALVFKDSVPIRSVMKRFSRSYLFAMCDPVAPRSRSAFDASESRFAIDRMRNFDTLLFHRLVSFFRGMGFAAKQKPIPRNFLSPGSAADTV